MIGPRWKDLHSEPYLMKDMGSDFQDKMFREGHFRTGMRLSVIKIKIFKNTTSTNQLVLKKSQFVTVI